MKRTIAFLAIVAFCAMCSTVYAVYLCSDEGTWPKSWPKEMEPLRPRSRTLVGPIFLQEHYQIPFTKPEEFEAAWRHFLKVKSKGAHHPGARPEDGFYGDQTRGRSHSLPTADTDKQANPEEELAGNRQKPEGTLDVDHVHRAGGGWPDCRFEPHPAASRYADNRRAVQDGRQPNAQPKQRDAAEKG